MSRPALWVALVVAAATIGLAAIGVERQPVDDRANVVVIMTDDMRLDELAYMPNVQRLLVERGVTFEQGLSSYPLCCPARSSMLTGQYSHNHGVQGNRLPRGGFPRLDDDSTLAVWLDRSGYTTALIGKYLNAYPADDDEYVPPGWDEWNVPVYETYNFREMTANHNGQLESHVGEHSSLVIDAASAQFADLQSAASRPFFLWSSYVAPHVECLLDVVQCWIPPRPEPVDAGTYAGLPLPDTPAFDERNMTDKGPAMQRPPISDQKLATMMQARAQRVESLQAVDRGVAHLVDRLAAQGELDNTYIFFVSDNGMSLGEHRLAGRKVFPYDEIVRIPLVMTGPGIPAGRRVHQAATIGDIATTILDIANLPGGRVQDGLSLLPLARGDTPDDLDRVVPIEAGPLNSADPGWLYQGVRSDRYTLIRWGDGFVELYDRRHDPAQVSSVAGDKQYADVQRYLESELDVLSDCVGRECVRWYDGPDVSAR